MSQGHRSMQDHALVLAVVPAWVKTASAVSGDSTGRLPGVTLDAAAAPARTELPSGPRRRWHLRSSAPRGDARSGLVAVLPSPGRPDAGSAVRKKPAVTNRDKKDGIRDRMAETGEPFSVARRSLEVAAKHTAPEGADRWELIEVEVATIDKEKQKGPHYRRHVESFWGRWVIEPDPETTRSALPERAQHWRDGVHYGVAQTCRGRIAVYMAKSDNPRWPPTLEDYDTLADAQIPEDIRSQAAAVLGIREVIHRDI